METTAPSNERFDVYRTVTNTIIQAIEAGAGEFVMPWHRSGPGLARPSNAITDAPYQGVNVLALWANAMLRGFGSGYWATYDQWRKVGAQVRKAERSSMIVFYKLLAARTDDEENQARLVARAFRVFNADQVDGWSAPASSAANLVEAVEEVERFVHSTKARVVEGGEIACYFPREDLIRIPDRGRFQGSPTSSATEAFYSTLMHELVHWSGASARLNRTLASRFGDAAYAAEELVAEIGAAFLCADLSISNQPRPDHAAYVDSWLEVLSGDKRAIFAAAQKAREAATFLSDLASAT